MNMNPFRTVFAVVVAVYFMITFAGYPQAIAQDQISTIGGYEVIEIGGVSVLKDPKTGIISYYNAAVAVAACSTGWVGRPKTLALNSSSLIGGVEAEFREAGFYQFEYLLEPWYGGFADLEGGQIVLIQDLALDSMNTLDEERMRQFSYSYKPSQTVLFNIPAPGSYIIGFGPYGGTLLPESIVAQEADPNVSSIRFRLSRFVDPSTLDDTGFNFKQFVDLSWKENHADQYLVNPIVKHGGYARKTPPSVDFIGALNDIPGMKPEIESSILAHYSAAIKAGYSTAHPFGKNVNYATDQFRELKKVFTNSNYSWNSYDVKDVSAAKIGLYLWRLQGKTKESQHMINKLLGSGSYGELIDLTADVAREQLSKQFPEYQ